jgi:acetyl esterase/lipase
MTFCAIHLPVEPVAYSPSGSKSLDNYNQPILADVSWFSGVESIVKDILIWGGGGEILIDSIDAFSKKLKEAYPKTEYVREAGASHEEFIMEGMLGYKEKAEGTKLVESWLKARL